MSKRNGVKQVKAEIVDDPYLDTGTLCPILSGDRHPWMRGLTWKQVMFVAAYKGNASEAAKVAGIAPVTGSNWLKRDDIREALTMRAELDVLPELVMGRMERQMILSAIGRNPHETTSNRIKAIELLGKMEGDFIDRVEAKVDVDTSHRIAMSLDERARKALGLEAIPEEQDDFLG